MRALLILPFVALLGACSTQSSNLPAVSSQPTPTMLAQVNAQRAAAGQAPVRLNRQLSQAATRHAQDMIANDFFSHTSSNGDGLFDRVKDTGYTPCFASENIAWGQKDEQTVMTGWMNSTGHRTNILSPKPTEVGFGKLDSEKGPHWVQVFARPC